MRSHDRRRTLTELAAELTAERTEADDDRSGVEAVTARALHLLPDADWASVTLHGLPDPFVTVASTDEVARGADELQYTLHEGPCLEAASVGESYRSGDVGTDGRWPHWGPRAAELGVRSVLSVQLPAPGAPLGSMNLYSGWPGRFDDVDEVDLAVLYGVQVAAALTPVSGPGSGLRAADSTRHTIGVAQGVLMERYRLGLDTSLDLLRSCASSLGVRLVDLAGDLVATDKDLDHPWRLVPTGASLAEAAAVMAAFGQSFVVVADLDATVLSAGDLMAECLGRDPQQVTVGHIVRERRSRAT